MATAINTRAAELKLEYGKPETVAFRYLEGKTYDGQFGMRVMFTLIDERKLWLDAEDGGDLERALNDLGIQRAEFVQLTKIRHARGGGHSLRVEPAERERPAAELQRYPPAAATSSTPASTLERQLAASLREREAPPARQQPAPDPIAAAAPGITPATAQLCAAFMVAIDAMKAARDYSQRSGLGDIAFNSEDLRACALSVYIGQQRGGR